MSFLYKHTTLIAALFLIVVIAATVLFKLPLTLLALVAAANVLSVAIYWYDKRQAKNNGYRISEKMLLSFSALGGWPASLYAQKTFRHKTQKQSFQMKFLLSILLNIVGIGLLCYSAIGGSEITLDMLMNELSRLLK